MACRQLAATAWDQTHPVHGGAFFFAGGGLSSESRPPGGLRNWERPRAGNDGGQGHSVVVVDRWGASTPHMGRARGLGTTWLVGELMTLARGSKAILTNLSPPLGPSPKCPSCQGGRKCCQVCGEQGSMPPLASLATQQYSNSYQPESSCLKY